MQLLDTSALIAFDQVKLPRAATCLSVISEAELRFGIEQAPTVDLAHVRVTRFARIERSFGSAWLPFDSRAAESYARLAGVVAKARPRHARSKDIMLAGHAHAVGAAFVTLNPKDFELVSDLVEIVVPELR